jgi:CheY-like chemotaxis protein
MASSGNPAGTSVKMYFPRSYDGQEAIPIEPGVAAEPLPQGTETILLVEDDEDVRSYSTNAARHLGYNVLEASDAASAIAILDARPDVSLLFTDVGLPGMNGRTLADHVRATRPEIKTVFTSGYARTAIANLGLLERSVLFLPKPFRIESLAQMLRNALDAD